MVAFITALVINTELWSIVIFGLKRLRYTEVINPDWLKASSRWIINSFIFQLISVLDLLIVSTFGANKYSVGHYAAALTIIYLIWLLPATLYQGLKPRISSLISSAHGRRELQSLLNKTNAIVILIIVILSSFIIYYSSDLLAYFGPTYVVAKTALIILTVGVCLGGCTKIAILLLIYADFEQAVLNIRIAQLVLMFVLVIPATCFYDITGTAIATVTVMCLAPVLSIIIVHKKLKLRSVFIF
jgi:O-antigen/teichoic acid export membrane protein